MLFSRFVACWREVESCSNEEPRQVEEPPPVGPVKKKIKSTILSSATACGGTNTVPHWFQNAFVPDDEREPKQPVLKRETKKQKKKRIHLEEGDPVGEDDPRDSCDGGRGGEAMPVKYHPLQFSSILPPVKTGGRKSLT